MSLTLTIPGAVIPTSSTLLKDLRHDAALAFALHPRLAAFLTTPLNAVPADARKTAIAYTGPAASWNPGAGPLRFGLQAGAAAALDIVTAGDLLTYTDGLDNPQPKSIPTPPDTAFCKVTLHCNLSANAAAAYSGGPYGATASLDTAETYAITFCKAFPPSTPLGIAVAQTFESFILPMHEKTLAQLDHGDFLQYEFDGNLHLCFGAYAGLSRVLYAGQSTVDVVQSCASPLATLTVKANPASANLDFKFQYATRFEAILSKLPGQARLHLFRSVSAAKSATLKAHLSLDGGLSATVAADTKPIHDSILNAAADHPPLAREALGKVLAAGSSEIAKYTAEANDKLACWLNRANGVQTNLQVAIETTDTRTILVGYLFDLTSSSFPAAWQAAIAGDFIKAFSTRAVTLDPGSGLEHAYQSKTSFSCNFFNLWSLKTWNDFSSKMSLVYAGNNVFHFVASIGRATETDSIGAMHSMDFFFAASADTNSAGAAASHIAVDLHIDLTAQADPKAAARIAAMLAAIGAGPATDTLARNLQAFAMNSPGGTAQLKITIPASAYGRIQVDPIHSAATAHDAATTPRDALNWNAFARGADDLDAWPLHGMAAVSSQNLAFLKSFTAWQQLNLAATGAATPNRLAIGNAANHWPATFPYADPGSRSLIVYSMLAAQHFMNFCAALRDLAAAATTDAAALSWQALLQHITDAIKTGTEVDFLRPAALAIVRLCATAPTTLQGPTGVNTPTNHFPITLNL